MGGAGFAGPPLGSNRDLIADRQATDTLAGGGEDRVAECQREGRDAGLANTHSRARRFAYKVADPVAGRDTDSSPGVTHEPSVSCRQQTPWYDG